MDIKLTISILLSDRIHTIEKCLESIAPILKQVPSELILTVTGKDPRVKQLAQQYTDHIIEYTWLDDFSHARNKGLMQAKGEWFMYLDDDEWFEDVTPIIEFFNSNEYKRYNGATYKKKDYTDWEGKEYHESFCAGLARRREDLIFVGKVHERYNYICVPVKEIAAFVHHYGYVNNKRKLGNKKVSRNLPLLLEMLNENSKNQSTIIQIIQEYANLKDLEKIEKYCRMGLGLENKYRKQENDGWIYSIFAKMFFLKCGVNQAIQVAKEGIEIGQLNEAGKMQLYELLARFYILIKEYENAIDSVQKYLQYYNCFKEDRKLCYNQTRGLVVVDEIMKKKEEVCLLGIQAAIHIEEEEKILIYLQELPWNTPNMLYSHYQYIYNLFEELSERQRNLLEISLTKIDSEDEFVFLHKMLYAHKQENLKEVHYYYEKLKNSEDTNVLLNLIWLASIYCYPIKEVVQKINIEKWRGLLYNIVKLIEVEEYSDYCQSMGLLLGENSRYYKLLQIHFSEQELLDKQMSGEELNNRLQQYTELVTFYYKEIYKEEMIQEQYRYMLPPQFAFSLYYMESNLEGYDQIECLKKAKTVYPRMLVVIKRLMEYLLKEYDRKHRVVNQEFQQLGVQVKQQVKQMIENHQYEAAFPIVTQLLQLIPDDLELVRLKQKILVESQ